MESVANPWRSGLVLPESQSVQMMPTTLWRSDLMLAESESAEGKMITPDPWCSGLVLPESGSVEPMPVKLWCSGLMLPESESVDMMLDDLWCSDSILLESLESVMPDDMWCVRRMVPPESGSSLILPERGMDPYAEEERTKWGSEKPEKERSIPSMLKSLELDEAEKMKAKNPMPDESISSVADAVPKAAAEGGKRRKKVMVTVSKEHIEYMKEHPLPPPYKPSDTFFCSLFREGLDMFASNQEAAWKERERILEDYRVKGYAEKEYEVTDDEEEV